MPFGPMYSSSATLVSRRSNARRVSLVMPLIEVMRAETAVPLLISRRSASAVSVCLTVKYAVAIATSAANTIHPRTGASAQLRRRAAGVSARGGGGNGGTEENVGSTRGIVWSPLPLGEG